MVVSHFHCHDHYLLLLQMERPLGCQAQNEKYHVYMSMVPVYRWPVPLIVLGKTLVLIR